MKSIALIPARSGSKRIPNKNILPLGDHPLLAYTISTALESKVFDAVVCITDSLEYAKIARHYGAEVPILRPVNTAQSDSPDISWVTWILDHMNGLGYDYEVFSILRPTSPLRTRGTILRAWDLFQQAGETAHSLRAVELCKQHPGKMWVKHDQFIIPLIDESTSDGTPFHSNQYDALPEIYVQNASLEIAWTKVIKEFNNISGHRVLSFSSTEFEGFDINYPEDLKSLREALEAGHTSLPAVTAPPYINLGEKNG